MLKSKIFKFQKGGVKPYVTSDSNDTRIRAYSDSLLLYNLSEKQRLKGTNNKENLLLNNKGSDVIDEREREWYQSMREKHKDKFFSGSDVYIKVQGADDRLKPNSIDNDYNNDEYFHPDIKPIKGYNWSTDYGLKRLLDSNDNFLYKKPTQEVIYRPNQPLPIKPQNNRPQTQGVLKSINTIPQDNRTKTPIKKIKPLGLKNAPTNNKKELAPIMQNRQTVPYFNEYEMWKGKNIPNYEMNPNNSPSSFDNKYKKR